MNNYTDRLQRDMICDESGCTMTTMSDKERANYYEAFYDRHKFDRPIFFIIGILFGSAITTIAIILHTT